MVNTTRNPATYNSGVVTIRRPCSRVAVQAKIWMPPGMVISRLAALKKLIDSCGRPTANMWCTHTPKLIAAVVTIDSTTSG
jgi:hypothetical protein